MDMPGVKVKPVKKQSRKSKKGIKVVYISNPMKVETCASNFRALVQELTGKDSDSAGFMDLHHQNQIVPMADVHDDHNWKYTEDLPSTTTTTTTTSSNYSYESSSPVGSDAIFDSFDKCLPPMDGSFLSMFQPNFLYDSSDQLDLFN